MNTSKQQWILLLVVAVLGVFLGRATVNPPSHAGHGHGEQEAEEPAFWTCSMHPQIQQPGPGDCPLCGMDLIPVVHGSEEELGPRELKLSARAEALAEVEVTPVERRFVKHDLRLVGKIELDETRIATISSWVAGRLERLYVDYTGIEVKEGDHLVTLYSPELIAAQEELIQVLKSSEANQDNLVMKERTEKALEATRTKLALLGITDKQIAEVEKQGKATEYTTIYSPISGVVLQKHAKEGQYVKTGSPVYTVVDLSQVWVKLDAYESDLSWLHFGQSVSFSVEAYPGETFAGKIAFIDPLLNPKTRTVKVRVNVDNADGRLKPEMFVRASVEALVALGGKVYAPELAGKWISPMHPEIIKDAPGTCDVCGMDLVQAESLGYVMGKEHEAPLVIPATAPLITGKRAVVYVKKSKGLYEGREVVLGPRAGSYYLVYEGLEEGDQVVVSGAFKLDSAIQIQAKPSMMTPREQDAGHETQAAEFSIENPELLQAILPPYLNVQEALAGDNLQGAKKALKDMMEIVGHKGAISASIHSMLDAGDLDGIRRPHFDRLSQAVLKAVESSEQKLEAPLYHMHCPMVYDDGGADWLQRSPKLVNPYFGDSMLHCGTTKKTFGGKQP